jgi:MFS family permease
MDISSELIHGLLPLFLVGPLGVSVLTVGVIEGVAEAATLVTKVFSGTLSDLLGRRKVLVVAGYTLAAVTKPAFALAQGPAIVVAARLLDRIGKGVREAPRDALMADMVPAGQRGAAYGLRQALDSAGAFAGPLLATLLMLAFAGDFRAVFWVAVAPAVLAVALLVFGVREPQRAGGSREQGPIRREAIRQLGSGFWAVVGIGAVIALARFSEAFLVLRAQQSGIGTAYVPLVMVAMNLVYSGAAYPFGRLADRMSRSRLLALGLSVLVVAHLLLAWAASWPMLIAAVGCWGLHLAMTQGLLAAMVANAAPPSLRGTAFGLFNLASGLAMLLSSALAGALWDAGGPRWTFVAGALFAAAAAVALVVRRAAAVAR